MYATRDGVLSSLATLPGGKAAHIVHRKLAFAATVYYLWREQNKIQSPNYLAGEKQEPRL